jgi:thermosome
MNNSQLGGQPILILPEGANRILGRDAQRTNIAVAKAVANAVRSTLGPKGMDKMLVDELGDITITNDGATILEEMNIEHPAGKMLVEVAKTQDDETGDGTTTAVILAGELLKKAEGLLDQNIHPSVIINGYRMAQERAIDELDKISDPISLNDDEKLVKVAVIAMTSKGAAGRTKEGLAKIIVKAVKQVADKRGNEVVIDEDYIKLEKKEGGDIDDSELINGVVVDKERVHPSMPTVVKKAKIALLDAALEIKETETDAEIRITSPDQLQAFLNQEEKMLKDMVEKVVKSGATVVFCQKGIDDMAQHFLAKAGIYAARRAKKSDMEKLARATGASIVTNLSDLNEKDLGYAGTVEEKKVAGEAMTFVEDCKNAKAVTILIRGGTQHVVDEAERAVVDGIGAVSCAIEMGKIVFGGGAIEASLAVKMRDYAKQIGGREQLAIEAFADALEIIPRTLAESAGMDPIDTLVKLRSMHAKGSRTFGINVLGSKVDNMKSLDVIEPTKVKRQAIASASEAAGMILKIDDIIAASKPRGGGGMPPGGMGGEGMPEMD